MLNIMTLSTGFNPSAEAERLVNWIRSSCVATLKRDGGVIGVSGGIDSATVLQLAVNALGPEKVIVLMLPDRDSSPDSALLAEEMASNLGVKSFVRDITPALEGFGCYESRDNAVKAAVADFDPATDKFKIVLPQNLLGEASLNIFSAVVIKPDGSEIRRRLSPTQVNEIVAASNLKQRARMMTLYHEAERRNYAVIGTGNKNEHDLGFFVKYGDGGVDLQPIRHLFKTQVYAIAREIGVPEEIINRPPTTDTYPADTTQEEFFYRLPFELLDGIWEAHEKAMPAEQIASSFNLTVQQVRNVIADITDKKRTTDYLRLAPLVP
jgi:NAD+ synthase